jgi:hypothetical protein
MSAQSKRSSWIVPVRRITLPAELWSERPSREAAGQRLNLQNASDRRVWGWFGHSLAAQSPDRASRCNSFSTLLGRHFAELDKCGI